MSTPWRPRAAEAAVLLVLAIGGGFSYYQLGSGLFACGKDLAGPQIKYWMALAAVQSLLFMAAAFTGAARGIYRILQYLTLPLVAVPLVQLALAYPRIFVALGTLATVHAVVMRRPGFVTGNAATALLETTLFLITTLIIHASIVFFVLHSWGLTLDNRVFLAVLAASGLAAAWIVRRESPLPAISIAQFPPLALLLVVLLRAKLPDNAYDSLFYKATIPIMIADWRTAITGVFDHTLLGTDLGEVINSQLRILDPQYSPALNSSFSFLALWIILPLAADALFARDAEPVRGVSRNATVLLLASLSEPLIAAGTAYHEPMLSLLLAGSLLSMSVGYVFLAAAIASKATALFIAPLIVALKAWPFDSVRDAIEAQWRRRTMVLAACLALSALAVGEQFYRNLSYTGRLTGITESLVSLTDPQGKVMARADTSALASPITARERYLGTFIHVLTLDRWIPPKENGFHVIPTSRLMAIVAVLFVVVLVFRPLRTSRRLVVMFGVWAICAAALLQFVTQGRHLFPLSFGAAVLVALVVSQSLRTKPHGGLANRATLWSFAIVVALVAFGDQLVGSFINDGWDCRRDFDADVVPNNYDRPETSLERRLASIASAYRSVYPHRGVAPTILCENTVGRVRYLGAHYVFAYPGFDLTLRYLAAHPKQRALLPTSLLAVCFTSDSFANQLLPPEVRKDFVEVEGVKTQSAGLVRILISRPLMAGAKGMSLFGKQMPSLARATKPIGPGDLMPLWSAERLTNVLPADAPGGKGAFVTDTGGERVGALISPFAVQFEDIDFDIVRGLEAELAMPYSNSDGMAVEFAFEGSNGARAATTLAMSAKPEAAPAPAWETRRIPVPAAVKGRGTLTVTASSPTGNSNADWLFFRRLKLLGAGRDEGNQR